jgi:hypothetical protein
VGSGRTSKYEVMSISVYKKIYIFIFMKIQKEEAENGKV